MTTRPLRVLTLIDAFRMGGAETLLAPLAVAARDSGVEMDFVSVSPDSMNADKTMRILREADVHPRSLGITRLLDPRGLPTLVREIRRSRCDVVHSHLEMAMTLAAPAARLARVPAVSTFHHVARPLSGRASVRERLAVEAASVGDRAVFVSQASLDSFREVYRPRGAPDNWEVVHNGIDLEIFQPGMADSDVRFAIGGTSDHVVVLPAAFRDFKGIPVAIRAWPMVRERFPDAVLSLVGGGELHDELRSLVAALDLQDAVLFAGVRTDMPAVYRAADIVLLPSTHGENLPTVLIEAAACGRPVAASRIGGVPDIVDEGQTGLLFEPHDETALADTVSRMLADRGLRHRLGEAAEKRARSHFSAAAWMDRLHSLYDESLSHRGRPR